MTDESRTPRHDDELADTRDPQRIDGPRSSEPTTTHLVVGFDRYPSSSHALAFAIGLAAPLNAHLHVLHIADLDDYPIDPDGNDWEQRVADALDRERTEAITMLAALPGNWTYYARRGDPAGLLTTTADANDALMIIIGASRGGLLSALDRMLGESISGQLTRHGHRPVVLVPVHSTTYSPSPQSPGTGGLPR